MNKNDLVVLIGDKRIEEHSEFLYPNTPYRCSELDKDTVIVYGIGFDKKEAKKLFKTFHSKVIEDWKEYDLIGENNEPLNKTQFKEKLGFSEYGRGKNKFRTGFLLCGGPKVGMYAFYPMQDTKTKQVKECYQMYLDTIDGDMDHVDCKDIIFGNSGYPLTYGEIRVRYWEQ